MNSSEKLRKFISIIRLLTGIISVIFAILGIVVTVLLGPVGIIVAIVLILLSILSTYIFVMFLGVLVDLVENTAITSKEIETGNTYLTQINSRVSKIMSPSDNRAYADTVSNKSKELKNRLESYRNTITIYLSNNHPDPHEQQELSSQLVQISKLINYVNNNQLNQVEEQELAAHLDKIEEKLSKYK